MEKNKLPTVSFGSTGRTVTRVGLGGEGVLRTTGKIEPAHRVIRSAVAEGITYYDSARVYSDSHAIKRGSQQIAAICKLSAKSMSFVLAGYRKNGFACFSCAIVVVGPWPV